MLVPHSRLLFYVALIILPLALFAAIMPTAAPTVYLGILGFVLLSLIDAVLAYSRLEGIQVEFSDVIRCSRKRESVIDITVTHPGTTGKKLRLGLAWPHELASSEEDVQAILPKGHESIRLTWPFIPLKRGSYVFDRCYLESASPLGFWGIRGSMVVECHIRVYPDLSGERDNLAALFLHRGNFGIHAQRQIGKGREFEKLREYMPGDSFDEIHWKATAKRGKPITKIFQIERTQEVYVLIDTSRLSVRSSFASNHVLQPDEPGDETILERCIVAAMVLGLAAQKQGDLFGVVAFHRQIHTFVRARSGKAHYGACRDALYRLEPDSSNPDFDELCTFLRLKLRRRALLLVLTSLDDPVLAENFTKNIQIINRQHLVMVNMLRPAAAQPIFSNPQVASVDELYRELGGHALWHDLQELERALHHRGVHFSLVQHEKMCVELVSQYIGVKRRQLL